MSDIASSSTGTSTSTSNAQSTDTIQAIPTTIGEIEERYAKMFGQCVRISGRVIERRKQKNMTFADVADGTEKGLPIKCIIKPDVYGTTYVDSSPYDDQRYFASVDYEGIIESVYPGTTVEFYAIVVDPPPSKSGKQRTQSFELTIIDMKIIGTVGDPTTYPIQKSSRSDYISLRSSPFSRMMAPMSRAIFDIRSGVIESLVQFMRDEKVRRTDPNILTVSDCEGAGEVFKVQMTKGFFGGPKDSENVTYSTTHGLTVSSQLPLEAFVQSFRKVYTLQKSFRAEESDTSKHLAEFTHLEYEESHCTLTDLIDFTERMLKTVIPDVIERYVEQYKVLSNKIYGKVELEELTEKLMAYVSQDFVRIKHHDAIDMMQQDLRDKAKIGGKRLKFKVYPRHGEDLGSEHEKYLVQKFGTFVFVTHWPSDIKSFYMKQTYVEVQDESGEVKYEPDGTCESFDLLAPVVGELFGGSAREWRLDVLKDQMEKRGMEPNGLEWYIKLREVGTAPHAGWGMGVDRLVMLMTGCPSVRDCVPLPVYYGHCPY